MALLKSLFVMRVLALKSKAFENSVTNQLLKLQLA